MAYHHGTLDRQEAESVVLGRQDRNMIVLVTLLRLLRVRRVVFSPQCNLLPLGKEKDAGVTPQEKDMDEG